MKKLLAIFLLLSFYSICEAQTDYKQVYDESLHRQIESSGGMNDEWGFYPSWYYNILHNRYKSRNYENNNKIPLDSMNAAARQSLLKVTDAHESIKIVYENEKRHWEDRNSDREIAQIMTDIENAKKAIQALTNEFTNYSVPLGEAQKVYNEYGRINDKYLLIGNIEVTHMDNSKRRRAYTVCLNEYVKLINVCYRINNYCLVASMDERLEALINENK
ncbi:MAG: hypothetical protein LBI82_05655 [Dysgonamonadaceae bacterium]|jgi:hypothetical protein|nr:hypothetical protein [Dysgonamonadaceae bacterium]